MSVLGKIKDTADEMGFEVYRVKYLDSYGFAEVYFKSKKLRKNIYYPALVVPIKDEDVEDYNKFLKFLSEVGLNRYFDLSCLSQRDEESIVALLNCCKNDAFVLSGKDKPHEDKSEKWLVKCINDRISESLEPLQVELNEGCREGKIVCFYNEGENSFIAVSDDIEGYEK